MITEQKINKNTLDCKTYTFFALLRIYESKNIGLKLVTRHWMASIKMCAMFCHVAKYIITQHYPKVIIDITVSIYSYYVKGKTGFFSEYD